jgi:hypothetical protein
MGSWPPPAYTLRQTFDAPLPYVFRWLTDYSSEDPTYEEGSWKRKVIENGPRRAVLEDLTDTEDGWEWYRTVVDIHPPDRWNAELHGNVPDWKLSYRLTPLGRDRTTLTIQWRMRKGGALQGRKIPPKADTERSMRRLWRGFAAGLDEDYRRSRKRH